MLVEPATAGRVRRKAAPCTGAGQCSATQRWKNQENFEEDALFVGLPSVVFTAAQSDRTLLAVSQKQGREWLARGMDLCWAVEQVFVEHWGLA